MTTLDVPATERDRRLVGGKGTFPHDSLTSRSEGRCHPKCRSVAEEARSALTLALAEATPTVDWTANQLRNLHNVPSRSRRTSTPSPLSSLLGLPPLSQSPSGSLTRTHCPVRLVT